MRREVSVSACPNEVAGLGARSGHCLDICGPTQGVPSTRKSAPGRLWHPPIWCSWLNARAYTICTGELQEMDRS